MKKIKSIFVIFSLLLLLVGCNLDIATNIYVTDIEDFMKSSDDIYQTNAKLKLQISSEEKVQEYIDILREYFKDVKNPKLTEESYTTYLNVDISIPVIKNNNEENDATNDIIAVIVSKTKNNDFNLGLYLNSDNFDKLNNYLHDKYWSSIKLDELYFKLIINNDKKSNVKLYPQFIYFNNEPVLNEQEFILQKRENAEIRLSDVVRDYIYKNGRWEFIRISL